MYRSHDRPRLALAGFFLVLGVAAVQGRYQDAKKDPVKYKITVAAVKDDPNITLRPNVRQRVYVSVTNPSAVDAKLTVVFKAGGKVEATGKVDVGSNDTKLVKWEPIPAKKDAKDGKDALDGPFEIVISEKDGKPLESKLFAPLQTMSPFEYLTISNGDKGDVKRLSLKASAKDKFVGPSARIALDIPPDRIKGEPKGTFSGFVAKGGTTELVAEPIEDTTSKELVDAYSLDVDGIKRGLLFRVTTVGGKSTVETDNAGQAALLLPRFTRPTDKLAVDVLTSGNIYPDDRVAVSVLSTPFNPASDTGDKYVPVSIFTGPRQVRLRADVSLDGNLYLEPVTAEHKVTLNLSGIFGRTKVRVGVYSADSLDEEGNLKTDAKVRGDTIETTQVVSVSDTAPKVELKGLKRTGAAGKEEYDSTADAERGRTLRLRAVATSEAPIPKDGVRFVIGKMPADGKLPPDALVGVEEGGDPPAWHADYPVPTDAKTPLEVTVVVTNSIGLTGAASVKFDVIDPIPDQATVTGKVFEGELPLDNVYVRVTDLTGTEVAAARSAGGKFALPNVPPGEYELYALREQTGAKGRMRITVKKPTREDSGVDPKDIELILTAPAEIKDKDKKKDEKKAKKARITGTVVEDERPQAGLTVRLYDPTGKTVVKTATTNAAGAFEFKDLEKGKYIVSATKSASLTKARAVVDLDTGETKEVGDMKLFR